MALKTALSLEWWCDTANVYDHSQDPKIETGTVKIEIKGDGIVGCTYYHHLLPSSNELMQYINVMEQVERLREEHPEISLEDMILDDEADPQFVDLPILIQFPEPIPLNTPGEAILKSVAFYVDLLQDLKKGISKFSHKLL